MSWAQIILGTPWLRILVVGLPFVLSAITIWMTLLAGNLHPRAWLVGLVAQALWLVWIVATKTWGLLPMNLALWVVYGRNHLKWKRDRAQIALADRCMADTLRRAGEALDTFMKSPAGQSKPLPQGGSERLRFRRYNPQAAQD